MLNEKVLQDFLTIQPDEWWNVRSIPLSELGYKNIEDSKVEELLDLLDYITILKNNSLDDFYNYKFAIRIVLDKEPYYLLEMIWE